MANIITVTEWAGYCGEIESYHDATPAEVAEAHPKCGTCEHCKQARDWTGVPATFFNGDPLMVCDNTTAPSFRANITPALDYCRHHSELNKERDDETTHG